MTAEIKLLKSVEANPDMLSTSGVYSQAWSVNGLVLMQGQTGITLDGYHTDDFVGVGDPAAQTRQAMENISELMEAAGGTVEDVIKMTIYVTDRSYRPAVYSVIEEYFPRIKPATTGIVVPGLADERLLMEIDAWGAVGASKVHTV